MKDLSNQSETVTKTNDHVWEDSGDVVSIVDYDKWTNNQVIKYEHMYICQKCGHKILAEKIENALFVPSCSVLCMKRALI